MNNETYPCKCGGTMEFTRGTLKQLFGKTCCCVRNVPNYVCSECGEEEYDLADVVCSMLHRAHERGITDVDFEEMKMEELRQTFIRYRTSKGFAHSSNLDWCAGVVAALDATGQRVEGINA